MAARKARRVQVYGLKLNELSDAKVAEMVGISPRQVRTDFHRALEEYGQDTVEGHRRRANARYQYQLRQLTIAIETLRPLIFRTKKVMNLQTGAEELQYDPDLEAVSRYDRLFRSASLITERIATLNGAVAPKQVHHAVEGEIAHLHAAVPLDDVLTVMRENSMPILEASYEADGTRVPSAGGVQ